MIRSRAKQADPSLETDDASPGPLRRARTGAEGGLVATVVMTAFRLPISRSLPPTDEFWRRYVHGDRAGSATIPAILLHLCYGMAAGVVFVALSPWLDRGPESRAELLGVATAVGYALVLSAFGLRVLLNGLLDQELSRDEALIFHLGHVVYGITLGAWLGSRRSE